MSVINRIVLTTDSNGVTPTGFTANADGPTMLRKLSTLLGACAQGAHATNLKLAFSPVAAQATVSTTTGSETANDTLTIGNSAITLKASGANATAQANIAAGTAGTSTSGASPATTTSGAVLTFMISINGDGARPVQCIGSTGAGIASNLQTAIRALAQFNSLNAVAYTSATVTYGSTYVVTSGAVGSNSTVVISGAGAATLKLGIYNGGAEAAGTASTLNNIATTVNLSTNAWAGICTAFVCGQKLTLTAALPGKMGNVLALAVSSSGSVMTLTNVWGASVAGSEGTARVYTLGLAS